MACIAFFICLFIVARRRRSGETLAMPLVVMGLGLLRGLLLVVTLVMLVKTFQRLGNVPAEDKSTVLAASISEAMNVSSFGAYLEVPMLIGAWWADTALRRKREERVGPAGRAPAGTCCAQHPSVAASHICARCGGFMCPECAATDGSRCTPCRNR